MIVAVALVRVMEVAGDQVVRVIAMGDRFMPAARAVDVSWLMAAALVAGRADIGVLRRDLDAALVEMVAVHGMQASVVEVVDMTAVADGGVAAALAMDMGVLGMDPVLRHGQIPVISESAAKG